jgi:DnaJ-class molecular chaperone
MPKVTVCKKCSGTGKIERKSKKKSPEEATIFLLCRPCNGTGWIIDPKEDSEPVDVRAELSVIDCDPQRSHDTVSYLKLLIRLIDERFPAERKK